jgi:hypothetical protein
MKLLPARGEKKKSFGFYLIKRVDFILGGSLCLASNLRHLSFSKGGE